MFEKIKRISKKNIILSIGIILCLGIVSSYAYTKFTPKWFSSVDTYNVVKEGFLTNKGYSNELSKHMSEQVFKRINIYQYEDLIEPSHHFRSGKFLFIKKFAITFKPN
ncbi:hypothetical protein KPL47_21245 [Clostridium estertheticum]|uniref:hypothetical protein n=1 Tax=Clostridium estertheticum TaxID=238834 RepID=UPI001C0E7786|nr:hypothetical protein [Clostridium estertheticum]MBU3178840.1 hypothetical protein [Clostridium estertheticum]